MNEVILVTGASSGIGKETAKLLAQKGYIVYGASRRLEKSILFVSSLLSDKMFDRLILSMMR